MKFWGLFFKNKPGTSEISVICSLLITTFLSVHLSSYSLLCVLLLSMAVSPQIQHLHFVLFGQISSDPIDLFLYNG